MHTCVSHKYYKQRYLNSFNQNLIQNIDRENLTMKPRARFVKFVKMFPRQTFAPYGMCTSVCVRMCVLCVYMYVCSCVSMCACVCVCVYVCEIF